MMGMAVPEKRDRRIALVVVDMQNKFMAGVPEDVEEAVRERLPAMCQAVRAFHEAKRPVVYVSYDGVTHCSDTNTAEGDAFMDGLDVGPDDAVVHKYHMNSFTDTCLADVVRAAGCDSVLLCGMFTEHCVSATYWGAMDHGLSPFLLKGASVAYHGRNVGLCESLYKTFDGKEMEENLANPDIGKH